MTKLACLKKRLNNKKGFTLVELLVVLAIMAILIAVAVPTMTGALQNAKDKSTMSDARAAYVAFELIRTDATNANFSTQVTNTKIETYIQTNHTPKIAVEYSAGTSDKAMDKPIAFYYTDARLGTNSDATKNKYIKMDLVGTSGESGKATVVNGAMPSSGNVVTLS